MQIASSKNIYDSLVEADATNLPHASEGQFDYVFMSSFLQFISEPQAVFSEVSRVLKPGGRLSFSFDLARGGQSKKLSDSGYFLFSRDLVVDRLFGAGLELVAFRESCGESEGEDRFRGQLWMLESRFLWFRRHQFPRQEID